MTEVSYYQPRTGAPGALALVIALHAAGIAGLALWKIDVLPRVIPVLETFTVTDPVEPDPIPPEPQPQPQPQSEQIFKPKTIVDLKPVEPTQPIDFTEVVLPPVRDPVVGPAFDPPPTPPAKQQAARAKGDVRALFSPDDYPAAALRSGETGSVRAQLTIGTNGRVSGCTIVASSRSSALDQATCRVLRAKARFTPARDSNGQLTGDSYTTPPIKWELVDGG